MTFAVPDAAACENTMWASPRFSEASGSELLQHERTAGLGKKPAAAAEARVRGGGKDGEDETIGVRLKDGEKSVFIICKEVNASTACVRVFTCAYMQGCPVCRRQTEDCNSTGQVSVRSAWRCECKSSRRMRATRLW